MTKRNTVVPCSPEKRRKITKNSQNQPSKVTHVSSPQVNQPSKVTHVSSPQVSSLTSSSSSQVSSFPSSSQVSQKVTLSNKSLEKIISQNNKILNKLDKLEEKIIKLEQAQPSNDNDMIKVYIIIHYVNLRIILYNLIYSTINSINLYFNKGNSC